MPLLILVARILLVSVLFAVTEKIISNLIDKDEETLLDEILSLVVATGAMSATQKFQLTRAIKAVPPPANLKTPEDVADYLKGISENKKGLAALNARLGGFAPLAIKATKMLANIFTKKGLIITGGILVMWKIVGVLLWTPQLVVGALDQGTFNPEQANDAMEALGLPWRWPTEVGGLNAQKPTKETSSTVRSVAPEDKGRTIIRMVQEKKPEQFIGTLFSAKLGDVKSFERNTLDEITNEQDLIEDVKLNLSSWLQSFPGRLGYSIVIRKDPVDHTGVKQSGIWATLTMHMTRLNGSIQPIDTILLGPVSPATKLKLSKQLTTIEAQIPQLLTGETVRQIEIPSGAVDIFDTRGDVKTLRPVEETRELAAEAVKPAPKLPTEPTDAQLAARVNPTPVDVRFPLDGIFRATGDFGTFIYKRWQNGIYRFHMDQLLTEQERRTATNAGGVADIAKQRLEDEYLLNWNALPTFNIGDLQNDRTVTRNLAADMKDIEDFLAVGVNTPANVRLDTLNA